MSEDECDLMETDEEEVDKTEEDGQMETDVELRGENWKQSDLFIHTHVRTWFVDYYYIICHFKLSRIVKMKN